MNNERFALLSWNEQYEFKKKAREVLEYLKSQYDVTMSYNGYGSVISIDAIVDSIGLTEKELLYNTEGVTENEYNRWWSAISINTCQEVIGNGKVCGGYIKDRCKHVDIPKSPRDFVKNEANVMKQIASMRCYKHEVKSDE